MFCQRTSAANRPARTRTVRTIASCRAADWQRPLILESLESRELLSATPLQQPPTPIFHPLFAEVAPQGYATPVSHGYTPAQIRHAYGLDQVMFGSIVGDGTGQTIAIVDAYHAPTIAADLHAFDVAFGLPDPPSFRVVAQDGSTNYPRTDPAGRGTLNWETETALDVEWAHALAPGADILLVEANGPTWTDLGQAAIDYARRRPGVSVISMSFGANEFASETTLDGVFNTVAGHGGVTFVASSGDSGTPGGYPAVSPNVVGIGGTHLSADAAGNYQGESGWSGSGGGVSHYEPLPAWQSGAMSGLWRRAAPDVAFDADPYSGVPVYDSYNGGSQPWLQIGGTSFSAPAWAAIVAIADQGRALNGLDSFDGPTQLLPLLYSLPTTDFHDITQGSNGLAAGPGYDLVTGRGTPLGAALIADLAIATTYGNGGGTGGGGGGTTPPANDDFASAAVLSGASASALGTNIAATQQAGEPNLANVSGSHSVWWNWTAPAGGKVVVTTQGSDYDTTLGVFTGSSVNALTSIVQNDDESTLGGVYSSKASFTAIAGVTYHLAVNGYHGAMGNISLGLTETITPVPVVPANDNFSQRIALSGARVNTTGSNANATLQSGERRIIAAAGGHSVWWSWTAPATGQVTIATTGSNFDTVLGVYTGSAVNSLRLIALNDQQGGGLDTSRVSFRAIAGTTYQIDVDGYRNFTGNIALSINGPAPSAAAIRPAAMSPQAVDFALASLIWWQPPTASTRTRR